MDIKQVRPIINVEVIITKLVVIYDLKVIIDTIVHTNKQLSVVIIVLLYIYS